MLHTLFFFVIAVIASRVVAIAFESRETRAAVSSYATGQTPRPTPGPIALKAGLKRAADDAANIFARSFTESATCGWIDRDANAPLICNNGWGCVWWAADPANQRAFGLTQGAVDCCPVVGPSYSFELSSCIPAATCVDYNGRFNTQAGIITSDGTAYCGFAGKTCATLSFLGAPSTLYTDYPAGSSIQQQTFTALFCDTTANSGYIYQEVTNLPSSLSVSSSESLSSSTAPTNGDPGIGGPISTTSTTSTTSPTATGGSSSNNVGVIAGATVGGVVALAAIAAAVGFLVWRKKKSRVPPSREISTYEGSVTQDNSYAGSPFLGNNYNHQVMPNQGSMYEGNPLQGNYPQQGVAYQGGYPQQGNYY